VHVQYREKAAAGRQADLPDGFQLGLHSQHRGPLHGLAGSHHLGRAGYLADGSDLGDMGCKDGGVLRHQPDSAAGGEAPVGKGCDAGADGGQVVPHAHVFLRPALQPDAEGQERHHRHRTPDDAEEGQGQAEALRPQVMEKGAGGEAGHGLRAGLWWSGPRRLAPGPHPAPPPPPGDLRPLRC
jgi:hypothetical protein